MLNNLIKIAAYGLVGLGIKKAYDHFQQDQHNSQKKTLSLAEVTQDLALDPSVNLKNGADVD